VETRQNPFTSNERMNTQKPITVWDGVKIGCGIFIVLPAILLVATILFLMLVAVMRQGEKRAHGAEKRARPTNRACRHKP